MAGGGGSPKSRAAAVYLDGARHRALDTARNRLLATGVIFALAFTVMAGRLVDLTVLDGGRDHPHAAGASVAKADVRGDIVDRNGAVLATSLPTASVYADPKEVLDPDAAVTALARVLPDLDTAVVRTRLNSPSRFVWVRRGLTPEQQQQVNSLGIPGIGFVTERRRVYPHGAAVAHVVGFTDIDDHGIAGVEESFDKSLAAGERLRLGLDIRVQHILRHELEASRVEFHALGAAGMVLDTTTGEVIAMVSLPDFDPNEPVLDPEDDARFNRVTKGVYEMGSTMKLFTVASALDTGTTSLTGGYDASRPLHVSRFTISDYHAKNRWLSTPEILIYSSNVGAALMALDVGTTLQRQYLQRLGLLTPAAIELPEVGKPLIPSPWREINTMTVAFGHGIAITPLQLVNGVAALVNGGRLRPAQLEYQEDRSARAGTPVISPKTSKEMRMLMRQVVLHGTGSKADVPGYKVGGKTGTAEKLAHGHYIAKALISSFIGAFPIDDPKYVILAMLDEPKGNRSTANYATGGWVAAPVVARLVRHMAPLLGIPPVPDDELPDGVRKASAERDRQRALPAVGPRPLPAMATQPERPLAPKVAVLPNAGKSREKRFAAN
ncbi:MAG: penicillin-binding protein 2 [Rhodospirillales bacterium]|nr:penicillin-binding protein 2 [Rhodospirillales bacterium]